MGDSGKSMKKKMKFMIPFLLAVWVFCAGIVTFPVRADGGYEVVIRDEADLFTDSQEAQLKEEMTEIRTYGDVLLYTCERSGDSHTLAENAFQSVFHADTRDSGTVFMINMETREIYIYNSGRISRTITSGYSETITDNVYRRASAGDYYSCAREVFSQEAAVLSGARIAQPMKYVSNVLLAFVFSLFLVYILVRCNAGKHRADKGEIMTAIQADPDYRNVHVSVYNRTRVYDPPHSSSSSSGGSSSGGGHSF